MDKSKKIVFDEEGNPHEIYELETEADFKARGLPEEQRQKFIEAAREIVEQADVEDKAVVKARKKEKLRKRKEKLRGEVDAGSDSEDGGVELEDAGEDLLANFRADAEFSSDDDNEGDDNDDSDASAPQQPQKKAKKWFQSDSEDDDAGSSKKRRKGQAARHVVEQPETLEDMEEMAARMLG
jgi:ATP-dependent RNA helicase DDX10/DBP4